MIYLTYALLVPISLLITLLAVLLSPILPLFSDKDGWLPIWLGWFQTPDNSLHGDWGWQFEHWQWRYELGLPESVVYYIGMFGWLLRNPAYGFAVRYLDGTEPATWTGDKTIRDNANAKAGWCFVRSGGLFQFTWIKSIGFERCVRVTLGWNIAALVDDNVQPKPNPYQATFVFSPRLSGFKP